LLSKRGQAEKAPDLPVNETADPSTIIRSNSTHIRPWQVSIAIALMVMELSWVVPWYVILTRDTAPTTRMEAYLIFGIIMLATYLLVLFTNYLQLEDRQIVIFLLVLLIGGTGLSLDALLLPQGEETLLDLFTRPLRAFVEPTMRIPPEFIVLLATVSAWWRGAALARQRLGLLNVTRGFKLGVIMLLINGVVSFEIANTTPILELNIFLLAGVLALGGARLSSIGGMRGGHQSSFDRRWVIGVVVVAISVIALGVLAAILARGPLTSFVAGFTTMVLDLVSRFLVLVLWPVVFLMMSGLGRVVDWLQSMSSAQESSIHTKPPASELAEWLQELEQGNPPLWAANLLSVIKSILLGAIVILIVVFVLVRIRRLARNGRDASESDREWLLGPGDLAGLLRAALRRRADAILGRIDRFRKSERHIAAARIRRIYAGLMELSAELGLPRPAPDTPLEFLPSLGKLFPSLSDELVLITQAYIRVRYGEFPETLQEVESVEAAWKTVKAIGEELKQNRRGILHQGSR
jgi:hypothetical protein